jgi:hypothetical protein
VVNRRRGLAVSGPRVVCRHLDPWPAVLGRVDRSARHDPDRMPSAITYNNRSGSTAAARACTRRSLGWAADVRVAEQRQPIEGCPVNWPSHMYDQNDLAECRVNVNRLDLEIPNRFVKNCLSSASCESMCTSLSKSPSIAKRSVPETRANLQSYWFLACRRAFRSSPRPGWTFRGAWLSPDPPASEQAQQRQSGQGGGVR